MSTIAAGTTSTTALVSTGDTTGKLTFQTNGTTTAMTIDTSQNVGIGTSSPSSKVEVVGTGATIAKVTNTLTSVSDSAQVQCVSNDIEVALTAYKSGGIGQVGTNSNHPFLFRTNSTERLRIDSSGNVGIGTSSPGYKLDVTSSTIPASLYSSATPDGNKATLVLSGTVSSGNSFAGVRFTHNTFTTGWGADILTTDPGNYGANLLFRTSAVGASTTTPTERMRIDYSGSVAIGTTATAYGVSGSTPHKQTIWFDPASNYDGLFIACTASSGTAALFFSNTSGSPNQAGYISVSGATASYNSGSDYRMKENVKPMTGALEAVAKLKPVTFDWKDQFVGLRKQGQGFLAHELAEVVPDCVSGVKDEVDANGMPKYQAVDTSFLVATLTAAIQELKAEFDAYKAAHP